MRNYRVIIIGLMWGALYPISLAAQTHLVDIVFPMIEGSDTRPIKISQRLIKVRDINEQYSTGGLYLMTHSGNYDSLFDRANTKAINEPFVNDTWRYCSIFSTVRNDTVLMGRNWDNQNVGSIIVSRYIPVSGYRSIGITRAIDMGFPLNIDLEDMVSSPLGDRLQLAPFFVYDGMNERGLCAAITGIDQVAVTRVEGKKLVFVSYLLRNILDKAASIEEAVELVKSYVPFDMNEHSLNCHFFIVDSSGHSVILEYRSAEWHATYPTAPWQVMTNKVITGISDSTLRKQCSRYAGLSTSLEQVGGTVGWEEGIRMLQDVSQSGTTWSVIYSPTADEIYLSVYQDWNTIYHSRVF